MCFFEEEKLLIYIIQSQSIIKNKILEK